MKGVGEESARSAGFEATAASEQVAAGARGRSPRKIFKGGGGANGYFFVKLDFEIAVDQQTKTSDRTFEGVPDPNCQTVPAGQPRPYLVQIRPNLANMPHTHILCALLVASGHLNSYMKFHQDWTEL